MGHGQFAIIPARALDDLRFDNKPKYLNALLVLGTYADKNGWCYPSLKTIAKRLAVCAATASNTVKALESWGYLLVVRQIGIPGESNHVNQYRILHDAELPIQYDRTAQPPIQEPSTTLEDPIQEPLTEIERNVPPECPSKNLSPAKNAGDTPKPKAEKVTYFPIAQALSDVTGLDVKIRCNCGRLFARGKELCAATIPATPELIRQYYGAGGWWYTTDWRGQKGQKPKPEDVCETWGRWMQPQVIPRQKDQFTKLDAIRMVLGGDDGIRKLDPTGFGKYFADLPLEAGGTGDPEPDGNYLEGRVKRCT